MEAELVKERTMAGLQASRARGRLGGRPKKITPDQLVMARTLMTNPNLTMEQIAKQLGVGKSTLYRELARQQVIDDNRN
jgi:DNA invertase Pin-like site-specific DNA recombinase